MRPGGLPSRLHRRAARVAARATRRPARVSRRAGGRRRRDRAHQCHHRFARHRRQRAVAQARRDEIHQAEAQPAPVFRRGDLGRQYQRGRRSGSVRTRGAASAPTARRVPAWSRSTTMRVAITAKPARSGREQHAGHRPRLPRTAFAPSTMASRADRGRCERRLPAPTRLELGLRRAWPAPGPAIAETRHGADQALLAAGIAEASAQLHDRVAQQRFADLDAPHTAAMNSSRPTARSRCSTR